MYNLHHRRVDINVLGWTITTDIKHLNEVLFLSGVSMFLAGLLWLVVLSIYSLITPRNIKK